MCIINFEEILYLNGLFITGGRMCTSVSIYTYTGKFFHYFFGIK